MYRLRARDALLDARPRCEAGADERWMPISFRVCFSRRMPMPVVTESLPRIRADASEQRCLVWHFGKKARALSFTYRYED